MVNLGGYTLHSIETGCFRLDGGAMFGVIPKPLWTRRIESDDRNRIPLAMRCLLLEGHGRLVLVDNGLGDKHDARFRDLYGVQQNGACGELHASLRAAGFSADEVTDVVLTHLHFDHCGGSTRRNGDRLELAFPRAVHHVQRSHWAWATQPNRREQASFLRENLGPLAESGRLNLLEEGGPLFPGVDLLVMNGHTRGQQLVKISGPEGTLVFAADLIPTAAHIPLPWIMAYDIAPLETLDEKTAFLDRAEREHWHLFLEHDPASAVVSLERTDRGVAAADPRPFDAL